ncbi:MAG: helix-turn-helix domain-containing protein [Gammaproteobacteria bacterium]|nr:helix-turn-helix domain-containing protein [Gammaproteobacteria bacterium]
MYIRSSKELALLVVQQRKKMKLSQTAVANLVGLKQATISAFENKPESTKLNTLFQILSAINLDIDVTSKDDSSSDSVWQEEW